MPRRAFALMMLGALLAAGAQALTVTTPAEAHVTQSRTPVTFPVTLSNPGPAEQTDTLILQLPPGWVLLAGETSFKLAPGESYVELLTLLPPERLPAGAVSVLLRTQDSAATVQFLVPEQARLGVKVLHTPEFEVGGPYEVRWQVQNTGNTTERVDLTAQATPQAQVELSPTQLTLAPGESAEVRGTVRPPEVNRLQTISVTLNATSGQGSPLRAVAHTELIPKGTSRDQLYHVFPLRISVGGDLASPQNLDFTVSGKGKPVQGDPGTLELSASRKTFSLTYARGDHALTLGRLTTQANPLLSSSIVGAKGTYQRGNLSLAAYAGDRQGQLVAGTTLGIKHQDGQALFGVEHAAGHVLAGVQGNYEKRTENFSVKASGALAADITAGTYASQAEGFVSAGVHEFNAQYSRSSAGWKGSTTAAQSASARVTSRPTKDLTLSASANISGVDQPQLSANASVSLRQEFGTVGAQYAHSSTRQTLSGTLTHTVGTVPLQHYAAWTLPSSAQGALAQYQVTSTVKIGDHTVRPVLGLTYKPETQVTTWYGGVNGTLTATPSTNVNYGLTTPNLMAGDFNGTLGAKHTFPNGATVDVNVTTARQNQHWRTGVRVGGTLNVDVPIHRRTDIGRLEGRIRNVDGGGMGNVVLRAGDTATITDAQGRFVFEALPAGDVTVTALGRVIPADVRLDPALPLVLRLEAGKTRELNIQAVAVATLSGRVNLTFPSQDLLSGGRLLPEVPNLTDLPLLLTAEDGSTTLIAPNNDGTFSFRDLRAGNYTLSFTPAASAALARHDVRLPGPIALTAGQTSSVTIEVLLKPREVRIDEAEDLPPPTDTP